MLHESLQKDPTETSKRKPRNLRGTPAYKFGNLLCGGIILAFCGFFQYFSVADRFERQRQRFARAATPTIEEQERKIRMSDPWLNAAVVTLEQKKLGNLKPKSADSLQ